MSICCTSPRSYCSMATRAAGSTSPMVGRSPSMLWSAMRSRCRRRSTSRPRRPMVTYETGIAVFAASLNARRVLLLFSAPARPRSAVTRMISRFWTSLTLRKGCSYCGDRRINSVMTLAISSLYGRAASTRSWARRMRAAATSSIALVILRMFWTPLIRRRRSRRLGMERQPLVVLRRRAPMGIGTIIRRTSS